MRIRAKITQISCLQPGEQSVHTSRLMSECSYFSRGRLLPISKGKRQWRGKFGFNGKQVTQAMVKEENKTLCEQTLEGEGDLGGNPPLRHKNQGTGGV